MRIITYKAISDFCIRHKDAETALQDWYYKTIKADWTCYADIKKTFNSVDAVGNKRLVFNIKGNDYRLIVAVAYLRGWVFVKFIGSHKEYDEINAETIERK